RRSSRSAWGSGRRRSGVRRLRAPRSKATVPLRSRPRAGASAPADTESEDGRWAEVRQDAFPAPWPPSDAYLSAVENQKVRHQGPIRVGDEPHQVRLDLYRIIVPGEPESLAQSGDMGVHRDAFVDPKGIPQDDIGGLPPHAWEGPKLFHGAGHHPAVLRHDRFAIPIRLLALLRKKPVDLMISSSSD